MFSAAIKCGSSGGCVTPTVTPLYLNREFLSGTRTLNLGPAVDGRIIVLGLVGQGTGANFSATLGGLNPNYFNQGITSGTNANAAYGVWNFPSGTSTSLVVSGYNGWGGLFLYSIVGWEGFNVLDFRTFTGGSWSFNTGVTQNSVIFGNWGTNEDGASVNKFYNFGFNNRYFSDGGEEDTGAAYEINTSFDPGKLITATAGGKRPALAFISLSCNTENNALS